MQDHPISEELAKRLPRQLQSIAAGGSALKLKCDNHEDGHHEYDHHDHDHHEDVHHDHDHHDDVENLQESVRFAPGLALTVEGSFDTAAAGIIMLSCYVIIDCHCHR